MRQVCLQCGREAPVGTLWCQAGTCALNDKPVVLAAGESLGELTVVKRLVVLPASAVYRAERAGEPVLLKVAHAGYEERLKREAGFLLAQQGGRRHHPAFPVLLPAYRQAKVDAFPYGRAALGTRTARYAVFEDVEGETLRDRLRQAPQPWYRHAVWLTLSVADAIALMHRSGVLHLGLSPDAILVRLDRDGIPRPTLLDLGAVTPPEKAAQLWRRGLCMPAYRAPELIQPTGGRVGAFSDVYGLSLVLHEMLAGRPTYSYRLHTPSEVELAILNAPPMPTNRSDLAQVPEIVERGISKDYRKRHPDVATLAGELQSLVPRVPRERQGFRWNWGITAVVAVSGLAVVLLLALAAALGG